MQTDFDDNDDDDRGAYLPTPERIRECCLEFQAGWSDAQREIRNVAGWIDPECKAA